VDQDSKYFSLETFLSKWEFMIKSSIGSSEALLKDLKLMVKHEREEEANSSYQD
jgi:hypothetical protein